MIGFSSIGRKDSLNNIEATGEFVWNLVTRDLAEVMNQTCEAVPPEVNEFELAGLEAVESALIAVPRVALSPVTFECRLTDIHQLRSADHEPISSWLVLGEVVSSGIFAGGALVLLATALVTGFNPLRRSGVEDPIP